MSLLRHHQLLMSGNSSPAIPLTPDTWYDASDDSTISVTDVDRVTQWRDKSGNDYHASASNNNRPTKGDGYIRFFNSTDGESDDPDAIQRLRVTSYPSTLRSVYVVVENILPKITGHSSIVFCNNTTASATSTYHGVEARYRLDPPLSNARTLLRDGSNYRAVVGADWAGGKRNLIRSRFISSTSRDVQLNGVAEGVETSFATAVSGVLFIGTDRAGISAYPANALAGDINEICIFHSILSEADDAAMIDYLKAKWSIT